jgi:hypothetical protein
MSSLSSSGSVPLGYTLTSYGVVNRYETNSPQGVVQNPVLTSPKPSQQMMMSLIDQLKQEIATLKTSANRVDEGMTESNQGLDEEEKDGFIIPQSWF